MNPFPFIADFAGLPKGGDPEAIERGREAFLAALTGNPDLEKDARALLASKETGTLLSGIFAHSPFLSHTLSREAAFACRMFREGPAAVSEDLFGKLESRKTGDLPGDDVAPLMAGLRRAKRQAHLLIALCDITGFWNLEKVTGALSRLADATLSRAVSILLRRTKQNGEMDIEDESRSGFFVLGLGKLGGHELNYSSDVDLMVLYDPARMRYTGTRSLQECCVKMTRELVRIMEERTEEGYVFRTDLRLRPDPGSTPPAISIGAAEVYYESAGQNWERAALIKARPVAGDLEAGHDFIRLLRPFIWRKHLDFAAIQDIHSIKRQINAHRRVERRKIAGQNVKLGPGGIREIEFFAQTQQLIWGGREPALRSGTTLGALDALVEAGHVVPQARDDLKAGYHFLRRVEHRLQMVNDQQTHNLPESEEGLAGIAGFLGYPSKEEFCADLLANLERVENHYGQLFKESAPLGSDEGGNLVFTGGEDDPDTIATLQHMGFKEASRVADTIRNWHRGRYNAMRSERARQLLTELVPALLESFARTADPDAAFGRFDEFFSRLPAGVQILSLFHANPGLLNLVAEIMGSAPRLAQRLAKRPVLLDGVLSQTFFDPLPGKDVLRKELRSFLARAGDFEEFLDITRRWSKDRKFQLGVQMLRNHTDAETAGPIFSDIADLLIEELQPQTEETFRQSYGRVPESDLAILAMGRLGSREMTVGSDVDLIFLYGDVAEDTYSDGKTSLSPNAYFARLAQRIINAISAKTSEGELYEIDMRLRPSGESGPVASRLESFRRYQKESAWTWEHMALTRARVITGSQQMRESIEAIIRDILLLRRDPLALAANVADMRARIAAANPAPSPWQIKHARGGLMDVEFIAQYLQLRHAHEHPFVLRPNTAQALLAMSEERILDDKSAHRLSDAAMFYHRLQGLLRLCFKDNFDEDQLSEGLKKALARAGGTEEFTQLKDKMAATADFVGAMFNDLIGVPAAGYGGERDENKRKAHQI